MQMSSDLTSAYRLHGGSIGSWLTCPMYVSTRGARALDGGAVISLALKTKGLRGAKLGQRTTDQYRPLDSNQMVVVYFALNV